MNRKPEPAPRFAVNRTAMLSRLPGVKVSVTSKRFVHEGPKLEPTAWAPAVLSTATRFARPRVGRKAASKAT